MPLVTFDGPNKLIIANSGTTSLSVKVDLYSDWKEWTEQSDNIKYLQAMRSTGGDPVPGGVLGATYFLMNGWRIRPQEANHTLTVDGNLFTEEGASPFVPPTGTWAVSIISKVSTLVETTVAPGTYPVDFWSVPAPSGSAAGSKGKELADTAKIAKILLGNS